MLSATTMRYQAAAAKTADPWDEDESTEDDGWGPSWTKAYVGGMKVRQYVVSAVEASVSAAPQQPTSPARVPATALDVALAV